MNLSDHFPLWELTKSAIATRLGIDNSLYPEENAQTIGNLIALAEDVLEPIRAHFGVPFAPGSGFRCFDLEVVLCRASIDRFLEASTVSAPRTINDYLELKSHPKGEAADIEIPGVPNLELAEWIRDNLDFDQVILEFYKQDDPTAGWVHVSTRENNRNEVLTIGNGTTLRGLPTTEGNA